MSNKFFFIFFFFGLHGQASFADLTLLLKEKDHFAMIRHARAPGIGDPKGFKIDDCKTQRNLSLAGTEQAKALGKTLRSQLGPDFSVFTSQWCRCRDTARYLNDNKFTELPLLNSFFQNQQDAERQSNELKRWLKENLAKHHPLVLVTHQVNITELTGIFPGEGDILIFKMDREGQIERVH